jgi:hypothetical protein
MAINLTNYLGFLRTVVSNMETRALPTAAEVAAYMKERGLTQPSIKGQGITSIKSAGWFGQVGRFIGNEGRS